MRELKEILKEKSFRFNKNLGQNFLTDTNLLRAIVSDSGLEEGETVVEIGTGAGTLTRALAEKAGKVISFEVDENLKPVLEETLSGLDNVEVIFGDVLKMSDKEIAAITGGEFRVVANIPYYITTGLIMRFVESGLPVKSITVMIQKEVAERLVAKENTGDYGAITMSVRMRGDAVITRKVSRTMFYPVPNVDSAVVRIDIDPHKFENEDKGLCLKLVKAASGMRRKTFNNNLSASFSISKETAARVISEAGFEPMIRGEAFSVEDIVKISRVLKKHLNN